MRQEDFLNMDGQALLSHVNHIYLPCSFVCMYESSGILRRLLRAGCNRWLRLILLNWRIETQ